MLKESVVDEDNCYDKILCQIFFIPVKTTRFLCFFYVLSLVITLSSCQSVIASAVSVAPGPSVQLSNHTATQKKKHMEVVILPNTWLTL